MSSKSMEDIKVALAQEAFLEGFQIYLRRIAKNFPDVDLDLLTDEPSDEASPSNIGIEVAAASPIAKLASKVSKPATVVPEPARESKVAKNAQTSPAVVPPEVKNSQ